MFRLKTSPSSGLYNSVPDATAHFGIPECLHLLLNAILEIITNKQSAYKYACVRTVWKGRNVLSTVAAGCFFPLYLTHRKGKTIIILVLCSCDRAS